jgi:hypothetical protein
MAVPQGSRSTLDPPSTALELPIEEARKNYVGLFTEMLRQAHRDPDQSLTRSIRVAGQDLIVVPSRRLRDILPERVNEAAQDRSIRLRQRPQLRLECGDDTYIAQAEFTDAVAEGAAGPAPPPSLPGVLAGAGRFACPKPSDVFADLRRMGSGGVPRTAELPAAPPQPEPAPASRRQELAYSSDIRSALRSDPGFGAAMDYVIAADRTDHFETQAGVQITGATVTWAAAIGMKAEVLSRDASGAALVRLHGKEHRGIPDHPASVILQFEDGAGTVLAGLPGYIAAIAVEEGRVVNISYVPSTNTPLWGENQNEREHIESLRAMTAAAARKGFLASDRGEARRLADLVRRSKRLDPTLGLYACLAYASLGLRAEGRSVQEYMRGDLRADLFDVALLAGRMPVYPDPGPSAPWPLRGRTQEFPPDSVPIVPFCPMFSQSWSYLRPRGIELPKLLTEAGRHRRPSLWTSFEREGMVLLRDAFERESPP